MSHTPRVLLLSLALGLLLGAIPGGPQSLDPPAGAAGRSATLLPDGRWLLLGGTRGGVPVGTAVLWDPRTGATVGLAAGLFQARAWHSATVLPDGSVLVAGGVDATGHLVEAVERIHLDSQTIDLVSATALTPRTGHTATLLTDGRLLLTGGRSAGGRVRDDAEVWDPTTDRLVAVPGHLLTARWRHLARLLASGDVLFWGGLDAQGAAIATGEQYDPATARFTAATAVPGPAPTLGPELVASMPADGAVDVPTDTRVALRFSDPLRMETVTTQTVFLTGPRGLEPATVVPAADGMLAFLTPETALTPGARYTVTLNGSTDWTGRFVRFGGFSFTTAPLAQGSAPGLSAPGPQAGPDAAAQAADGGLDWTPDPSRGTRGWRYGGVPSHWQALAPLTAHAGVTALAGQVLTLHGDPLPHVTLAIGARRTETDGTGRFLLHHLPAGHEELLIDGRTASRPGRTYGVFEVGVDLADSQTTVLPYTIWMPKIDAAHAVTIPSPTTTEVVVTSPRIPGYELRIPAGSVIRDHEGRIVRKVSLTPIPLDRLFGLTVLGSVLLKIVVIAVG